MGNTLSLTRTTGRFQEWVEGPQSSSILYSVLEEIRAGAGEHCVYKAVNLFMVPGGQLTVWQEPCQISLAGMRRPQRRHGGADRLWGGLCQVSPGLF